MSLRFQTTLDACWAFLVQTPPVQTTTSSQPGKNVASSVGNVLARRPQVIPTLNLSEVRKRCRLHQVLYIPGCWCRLWAHDML